jgi:hypothetical protein
MAEELGLSNQALSLLQTHLAAIGLGNGGTSGEPTDQTREAYRELARAGLMGACHTFVGGRESLYRLTEKADRRREELLKAESASHRWRFSPAAILRRILRAFSPIGGGMPRPCAPFSFKWTAGESNPDFLVAGQVSCRWTSSPS